MEKQIYVLKASGERELYNRGKLRHSLLSAGADAQMASEILTMIEASLYDGVTTKEIYSRALSTLGHRLKSAAGRYRIKEALMQLGNSGHPFEVFTGELFKCLGYHVDVGIVVKGRSISHEMDVIATNATEQHLIECKYSQMQGNHVSIQVPLYVHSRVNDIASYRRTHPDYRHLIFTPWVVTNNRFSNDSLTYCNTYGLQLLSWDYPVDKGIKELIEQFKLYPITVLTSLTLRDKGTLIAKDIVSCPQLARCFATSDPRLDLLPPKKHSAIIRELKGLGIKPSCENAKI